MKKMINKPGVAFGGINKGFTIPSCGADGNLLLILDDEATRYTCTFENVEYGWPVDNILPLPDDHIDWIRTPADIYDLYNHILKSA